MPTYGKNNFKESNVNYLNKDFGALKQSLMNYAKSYFPDTYRDFNETSPGMMLLEMNAYVGDVLSFYIDQQYREMLLPLAEERRNIITMANMFGYKVKPIVPAYVDLTFTVDVDSVTNNEDKVDYSNAPTFDEGIEVVSSINSDIIFTTLEPIDFRITGSLDGETIASTNTDTELAETYKLSRNVRAVSATEKTISFQVGQPEKFKKLIIPDTNVVDIISCVDSNGQNWYEVDFLAQDKVPIQTHYTDDVDRSSAYVDFSGNVSIEAVPYSLTYITSNKRFTRETNLDNTTSLVFGNGVLKNGQVIDEGFIDMEQVGIIIPGQTNDLNQSIDPLLGDEYSTLGETPNNTTLTITYRVGGGIISNVSSVDLTTLPTPSPSPALGTATNLTVTNQNPARGGKDEEDTIEIKEKAKAFFSTQNRCVTKEDYEARVLNIPSKFGNIAKAYVTRETPTVEGTSNLTQVDNYISQTQMGLYQIEQYINSPALENAVADSNLTIIQNMINQIYNQNNLTVGTFPNTDELARELELGTINIYLLGYNNSKQLVGNPFASELGTSDNLPLTLLNNIQNYLNNFKLLTDFVVLQDGYIVNFGVIFDVVAEKYANKQQVKLDCIQKIKEYFKIEKMQFNQPIYKSNLEFELMGVEGVRSIGHITITQKLDYHPNGGTTELDNPTYRYSFANGEGGADINGDGEPDGSFTAENNGTDGYGYKYDFETALYSTDDANIIPPPNLGTPTVFELKNPNQNIQGRVR